MVKENKNKDQNGIDIKDKLVAINRVTKVVKEEGDLDLQH